MMTEKSTVFSVLIVFALLAGMFALIGEQDAETVDVTLKTPTYRATQGANADPDAFNALVNDFIDNDEAAATAVAPLWDYSVAAAVNTPANDFYGNEAEIGPNDSDDVETFLLDGTGFYWMSSTGYPIGSYVECAATPTPDFYGAFGAGTCSYSVGWVPVEYWEWNLEYYNSEWYACLYDVRASPTPMLVINMDSQYGEVFGERFPLATPTANAYPTVTPRPLTGGNGIDVSGLTISLTTLSDTWDAGEKYIAASKFYSTGQVLYYLDPDGYSAISSLNAGDLKFRVAVATPFVQAWSSDVGGHTTIEGIQFKNNGDGTATPSVISMGWVPLGGGAPTPTPCATIVAGQWYGMNFGEYTEGSKCIMFDPSTMRIGYDDLPTQLPTSTPHTPLPTPTPYTPGPTCTPADTPTPYTGICPLYFYGDRMGSDNYLDYATTGETGMIIPASFFIHGLQVGLATAPGGESSVEYTIRVNTTPVPFSVTISGADTYGSASPTTPIPVTPGAVLGVYMDETGTIDASKAHVWVTGQ